MNIPLASYIPHIGFWRGGSEENLVLVHHKLRDLKVRNNIKIIELHYKLGRGDPGRDSIHRMRSYMQRGRVSSEEN
jgi:hypothetical protein